MYRICLVFSTLFTAAMIIGCAGRFSAETDFLRDYRRFSPASAVAGSQEAGKITVSAADSSDKRNRSR